MGIAVNRWHRKYLQQDRLCENFLGALQSFEAFGSSSSNRPKIIPAGHSSSSCFYASNRWQPSIIPLLSLQRRIGQPTVEGRGCQAKKNKAERRGAIEHGSNL